MLNPNHRIRNRHRNLIHIFRILQFSLSERQLVDIIISLSATVAQRGVEEDARTLAGKIPSHHLAERVTDAALEIWVGDFTQFDQ